VLVETLASDLQSIRDRILRSDDDAWKYDEATQAFRLGGSRRDLMIRLMVIGLTADEMRWHAEDPGRRMAGPHRRVNRSSGGICRPLPLQGPQGSLRERSASLGT
jgi:hypothetical protein